MTRLTRWLLRAPFAPASRPLPPPGGVLRGRTGGVFALEARDLPGSLLDTLALAGAEALVGAPVA